MPAEPEPKAASLVRRVLTHIEQRQARRVVAGAWGGWWLRMVGKRGRGLTAAGMAARFLRIDRRVGELRKVSSLIDSTLCPAGLCLVIFMMT